MPQTQQTTKIGYVTTPENKSGEFEFTILLTRDAHKASVAKRGYIVAVDTVVGKTIYGVVFNIQNNGQSDQYMLHRHLKDLGLGEDASSVRVHIVVIGHGMQKTTLIHYGSIVRQGHARGATTTA